MDENQLRAYFSEHIYLVIGLGLAIGLVLGLLPLILGMRREAKGLAISGFIVCFLLGPVSGVLSLVAAVIFTILILRRRPAVDNDNVS